MRAVLLCRSFAWVTIAMTFAVLLNNYLTFWLGWPGIVNLGTALGLAEGDGASLALVQGGIYLVAIVLPIVLVLRTSQRGLRIDSEAITRLVNYTIRAAFWAVLFIGLADFLISFLRIEDRLAAFTGDQLATDLGRSQFRAPFVHLPMVLLGFILAAVTRTLGFHWLALLVVVAELAIVFSRFVFSYEQAFMADLVRFWYAALFLFASAHTLVEEGHVRVDVLYSRFSIRRKGRINAYGSVLLGMAFCWVILIFGMATRSSTINGPLISLEVTQSGFGLYVKYLMAGFLGIFAVSMMFQFCAYFLESIADARGEKGSRLTDEREMTPEELASRPSAG